MTCGHARRLFGACWDDEITQAEREGLEAHFGACPRCRTEYDEYSRALELLDSLPRIEPAADLVERVIARSRRAAAEPDRVGAPRVAWVPVTAAAAVVAVALALVLPWIGARPVTRGRAPSEGWSARVEGPAPAQPVLRTAGPAAGPGGTAGTARVAPLEGPVAVVSDSLFDHSADVEFILDPMTLHRGRPATVRTPVQGEQATITF
jgi:anti-sigma factor RsiW